MKKENDPTLKLKTGADIWREIEQRIWPDLVTKRDRLIKFFMDHPEEALKNVDENIKQCAFIINRYDENYTKYCMSITRIGNNASILLQVIYRNAHMVMEEWWGLREGIYRAYENPSLEFTDHLLNFCLPQLKLTAEAENQ